MKIPPESTGFPGRGVSLKGVGYSRWMNGRLYWSKWPRSQKSARTPREADARKLFAMAARATLYMSAQEQTFARDLAAATKLLPRDFLMICLFQRAFTLVRKDGTKVFSMASMQDISAVLDAIAQIENSMLVRGEAFWEALLPGTPGQALVIDGDGRPVWGGVQQPQTCELELQGTHGSPNNNWGMVPFNTVVSDTPGWAVTGSNGVRPNIPGRYLVTHRVRRNVGGLILTGYGKNGSLLGATGSESDQLAAGGSRIVEVNGTTDIIQTWVFTGFIANYTAGAFDTFMQVTGPIST